MLGAIALIFARHGNEVALGAAIAAVAGSFLVSYTRARRRHSACAATSASARGPNASS